jgi:hypothetical protein
MDGRLFQFFGDNFGAQFLNRVFHTPIENQTERSFFVVLAHK